MRSSTTKPTIEDVGREAGVSQTTVSFVLSGSKHADRISPETKQRIWAVAQKLGYSRNSIGTALQRGYSDTVVLLVVTWDLASTLAQTTVAVSRAVTSMGLAPVVLVAEDSDEATTLVRRINGSLNPFGLLLLWDSESVSAEVFQEIRSSGLPVVDLMPSPPEGISSVTADREQGFFLSTRHLIDLGHRRIGIMLDMATRWKTSNPKLSGYRRALASAGMKYDESLMEEIPNPGFDAGYDGLRNLMNRHPEVTAVACINDAVAIGAMASANDMGLRVPDDVSIAGYGGHREGTYVRPELTTVAVPSTQIAEYALKAIVDMRNEKEYIPSSIYPPMELIVRHSTGPVKKYSAGSTE
ncbi:MAG: LacI family DNA-binding transcriptional regulator [Armatimonadetes bacterium]|nr:LacI family DNA-binding transcriptional regulator [Armatimonadota bacterium]